MFFVWLKLYWIILIPLIVKGLTINNTNNVDPDKKIEDEKGEDYSFLVIGGYRPSKHILAKYIASVNIFIDIKKLRNYNYHYCGGSIIKPKVILTAAHCVVDQKYKRFPEDILRIIVGSPNLAELSKSARIHKVKKTLPHPKYSHDTMKSDVALIFLHKAIDLDGDTRSIVPLIDTKPTPGMECVSLGWGRIFPEGPSTIELVYVNLTLLKRSECLKYTRMYDSWICAAEPNAPGDGVWKGDSGGPLICDGKLVGVVSFGYPNEDAPSYFSSVYAYRKWISKNSGKGLILSVSNFLFVLFIDFFSLVMYSN